MKLERVVKSSEVGLAFSRLTKLARRVSIAKASRSNALLVKCSLLATVGGCRREFQSAVNDHTALSCFLQSSECRETIWQPPIVHFVEKHSERTTGSVMQQVQSTFTVEMAIFRPLLK